MRFKYVTCKAFALVFVLSACAFEPVVSVQGSAEAGPWDAGDAETLDGGDAQVWDAGDARPDGEEPPPHCGNGIREGTEECDGTDLGGSSCEALGYLEGDLRCTADCRFDTTGCTAQPGCGDGTIAGTEECDDGNTAPDDGCDPSCRAEDGWQCSGEPSSCSPICGDGLLRGNESCDDGNTAPDDGCDPSCRAEDGWQCSGEPSSCSPICGDGLVRGNESCDDRNTAPGDGCDPSCQVEDGWQCSGVPFSCSPICGDGLVRGSEQCDDQNTAGGDGCDANCQVEDYFVCDGEPSVCTCRVLVWERNVIPLNPDGKTWNSAYRTVQAGVDQAEALVQGGVTRCQVWVAASETGGYRIGDSQSGTVALAPGVDLFGGFCGGERNLSERSLGQCNTLLDGQGTSTHVVTADTVDATVDGFEIRGGEAESGRGGGLWALSSRLVLRNLDLHDSRAAVGGCLYAARTQMRIEHSWIRNCQGNTALPGNLVAGGGAALLAGSQVTVRDATFITNTTPGDGGGLYLGPGTMADLERVILNDNQADRGGGLAVFGANLTARWCRVLSNQTSSRAGGVAIYSWNDSSGNAHAASALFTWCLIAFNQAGSYSGGLRVDAWSSSEAASAVLKNCAIGGNSTSQSDGGAGTAASGGSLVVINGLIYGNQASESDGTGGLFSWGGNLEVYNSILWSNTGFDMDRGNGGSAYVEYSDAEALSSRVSRGLNVLSQDPEFVDPANADFHLQATSPCIDAGNNTVVDWPVDADGNPRIVNQIVDMGIYESQ